MTTEDEPRPTEWLASLRAVVATVEASDATEIEARAAGLRIAIRRTSRPRAVEATALAEPAGERFHAVRAPLTGVWYEASSPGTPPFIQINDSVDVGTVIGIIETMKIFNEIVADVAGVVRQIYVRRGELVTAHAPLIGVEPVDHAASLASRMLG